jgi:hypothetical protein
VLFPAPGAPDTYTSRFTHIDPNAFAAMTMAMTMAMPLTMTMQGMPGVRT